MNDFKEFSTPKFLSITMIYPLYIMSLHNGFVNKKWSNIIQSMVSISKNHMHKENNRY